MAHLITNTLVSFVGNLGKEPVLYMHSDPEKVRCVLRVAENLPDGTVWHTVVIWGKYGQKAAEVLAKGRFVKFVGAPRQRNGRWEVHIQTGGRTSWKVRDNKRKPQYAQAA